MDISSELKGVLEGEIDTTDETRELYSHDASLFELKPQVVVHPKSSSDIQKLVQWINKNRPSHPELNVTARSAGTDMSGGAIGESIVIDMTTHMNQVLDINAESSYVQPGMFYRDFDVKTKEHGSILPSYPASRGLASVGGMVANNSGGELHIRYGKTDKYVSELNVVFSDGKEYTVKPLKKDELVRKMAQGDFEGNLYKQVFELIEANYDKIQASKPQVTKDSTGYHLWDVWDRETGIFDMNKLIIGSQGTLGIITGIKFRLVPDPMKYVGTLVAYVRNTDRLGDITNKLMEHKPFAVEVFDDKTLWLSFKFIFAFLTRMAFMSWLIMCIRLIPNGLALFLGVPKLILLIEFDGKDQAEVDQRIRDARLDLEQFKNITYMEEDNTFAKADKFWKMRQESFSLLRSKVKDKHTAPYIDDFVVPIKHLEEFLPKIEAIIKKYKLLGTIAGHLGDGNFHVIPLMNIENYKERIKIEPSMKEVYDLVLHYEGSISGEHNDGMVRGPWLERMYGPEYYGHLKQVKHIFDPENIFNPRKKTDADWDFSFSHIRKKF